MKTLALFFVLCFESLAFADSFKTIDGKEYKNVKVKRVEPDGIVLTTSSGIWKLYFNELPKDVQERFHYNAAQAAAYSNQQAATQEALRQQQEATARKPADALPQPNSTAAIDSQGPAALMSQAESALRASQFSQSAELLNRIVSEYPASRQAKTVSELRGFLRDKQQTKSGPLTASEAQRLRSTKDAFDNIKRGYRTATPEKRQALETIFGADTLQNTDSNPNSRKLDATPESMAAAGIETLPPITAQLKAELLNALKMTDELDALYKRGCSSAEFIAAALPVEGVVMGLQNKLPKTDPRHDLLVNSFTAYQSAAVAMKANEHGSGERPDETVAVAGLRKHLLTKILQGNLTPEEKKLYYTWRNGLEANP